jgi:hypothetical protein
MKKNGKQTTRGHDAETGQKKGENEPKSGVDSKLKRAFCPLRLAGVLIWNGRGDFDTWRGKRGGGEGTEQYGPKTMDKGGLEDNGREEHNKLRWVEEQARFLESPQSNSSQSKNATAHN